MIGRIEVQNDIAYCKLNIDGINLPHKRKGKTIIFELPTNEEIDIAINKAKAEAFEIAEKFGMILQNPNKIDNFGFESRLEFDGNDSNDDDNDEALGAENFEEHAYAFESNLEQADDHYNDDCDPINIQSEDIDVNSPLTYIIDEKGIRRLISKSAYLWMITEPGIKMSNDRFKRF